MLKWFGNMVERLVGVAGALLFSQAPIFMLQYLHQMAGRVAELQRQVASMQEVAHQGGKTLDAFILKFVASADPDFRAQGQLMQGMVQRWHQLSEGLFSLQHAALWERPYLFLKHLDSGIVQGTYHTFEPGLPLTLEGGIYALAGLLLATALFRLFRFFIFSLKRPEKAPT